MELVTLNKLQNFIPYDSTFLFDLLAVYFFLSRVLLSVLKPGFIAYCGIVMMFFFFLVYHAVNIQAKLLAVLMCFVANGFPEVIFLFHLILQLIYQFFCLRQRYLGSCLLVVAFSLNSVMDVEETVSDITIPWNGPWAIRLFSDIHTEWWNSGI